MRSILRQTVLSTVVVLLAASPALAGGPVTWNIDLETSGEDVMWTSPTAVDPNAFRYDSVLTVDQLLVDVVWQGIPFTDIDVTDQLPPDTNPAEASDFGPAPLTLFDDMIRIPEPPEPVTFAGDLRVALDAAGFGVVTLTNVTLGTADVDLGGFIGVQTVTLTRVRIVGTVETTSVLTPPADLDGDGVVGAQDLGILIAAWGTDCSASPCPEDLDGSGEVGSGDLGVLIAAWGS